MKIVSRTLIFATFFGNCIIIGLLLTALVSNSWIYSTAHPKTISTSKKQIGTIEFGLFNGYKSFDHGYGVRKHDIDVIESLKLEPEFMSYWLWLFTALGAGFSLFSSAVSAVASVIGTIKKKAKIYLLVVSNIASGVGQIISFVCWMIQFFQYLTHNTLMTIDKDVWTTTDTSGFGYSFYFIIIAFLIVLVNIFLLTSAIRIERQHRKNLDDENCMEKDGNSIMLY
ncbi:unnamed protein product [Diamesa serratosioi]